jgi:hypothetical protein
LGLLKTLSLFEMSILSQFLDAMDVKWNCKGKNRYEAAVESPLVSSMTSGMDLAATREAARQLVQAMERND